MRLVFNASWNDDSKKTASTDVCVDTTWDAILNIIGRLLLSEPETSAVRYAINDAFVQFRRETSLPEKCSIEISTKSFEAIRMQFRALGIVTHVRETRKGIGSGLLSRDYDAFRWILTPYGERCVTRSLALRRDG